MSPPPPTEDELGRIAARLGDLLRERHWRLATAESSTGGLIGHALTMIPGASAYYVGGVIAYTNLAKEVELGVPRTLLETHGAVSAEVAEAMADGARRRFDVEVALAVTGIAGPEGGTPDKPIGLHYVSAVAIAHPPITERAQLTHDREGNKAAAAALGLQLASQAVLAVEPAPG